MDFETVQEAVASAEEGDTVRIKPGKYYVPSFGDNPENHNSIECKAAEYICVAVKGLTIEADDSNNPPVITGEDQRFSEDSHDWEHVQGHIYKTNYKFPHHHLTADEFSTCSSSFIGFREPVLLVFEDESWLRGYNGRACANEVDNPEQWGFGSYPYSTYDDLNHTKDIPRYWNVHRNVFIPGRFMYKENEEELYVWGANEDNPTSHTYQIPVARNLIVVRQHNCTIRNIIFKYSMHSPIYFMSADNAIIEDSFIINPGPNAIYTYRAKGLIIRRNFIKNYGYYERQDYISVRYNRLKVPALVAILDYSLTEGTEIYENVVSGGYGIHCGSKNCKIHDNIVAHSQSLLLMPSISSDSNGDSNVWLYNNILHHSDYSAFSSFSMESNEKYNGNIYFYRNLMYNMKTINKDGCHYDNCDPTPSVFIYHNTYVNGLKLHSHPYAYPVNKHTVYKNNLVYLRHVGFLTDTFLGERLYESSSIWYYQSRDSNKGGWSIKPFSVGPDSDYNIYYQALEDTLLGSFEIDSETTKYENFTKMCQDLEMDRNSLFVSPQFVNENHFAQVDNLEEDFGYDKISMMHYSELFGKFSETFKTEFQKILKEFDVKLTSPAIDNGVNLFLPDTVEIKDGKPDIGLKEYDQSQDPNNNIFIIGVFVGIGIIVALIVLLLLVIFIVILVLCIFKTKQNQNTSSEFELK